MPETTSPLRLSEKPIKSPTSIVYKFKKEYLGELFLYKLTIYKNPDIGDYVIVGDIDKGADKDHPVSGAIEAGVARFKDLYDEVNTVDHLAITYDDHGNSGTASVSAVASLDQMRRCFSLFEELGPKLLEQLTQLNRSTSKLLEEARGIRSNGSRYDNRLDNQPPG